MDRKRFIASSIGLLGGSVLGLHGKKVPNAASPSMLIPKRPKKGDKVAVISPAAGLHDEAMKRQALSTVKELGFIPVEGKNLGANWGYLGGRDSERVKDLHDAFENPEIKAVIALRGGYGTSRLLPLIDFNLIKKNPKLFIGYSDITSLLMAIQQETGLVTFHGPNAKDQWSRFSLNAFKKVLNAKPGDILENPPKEALETLVRGSAEGLLVGGNLSLISQSMGTPWEINTAGNILFFEEINESAYRIDRMLTQLWLGKKLQRANGFVIGKISGAGAQVGELNWMQVIKDRLAPLGKPILMNLSAGHTTDMITLPFGAKILLDASRKRIEFLSITTQK